MQSKDEEKEQSAEMRIKDAVGGSEEKMEYRDEVWK